MPRKQLPKEEKKSSRLTLYLRPEQKPPLEAAAAKAGYSLNSWAVATLEQEAEERPMKALEEISAFHCGQCAVSFWISQKQGEAPKLCPFCGSASVEDAGRWGTAVLGWRS